MTYHGILNSNGQRPLHYTNKFYKHFHCERLHHYRDADRTNFECSVYECKDGYSIITWIMGLKDLKDFRCYYHPDAPQYVYMDTATHWRVIALFTTALVMLGVGFWGMYSALDISLLVNISMVTRR